MTTPGEARDGKKLFSTVPLAASVVGRTLVLHGGELASAAQLLNVRLALECEGTSYEEKGGYASQAATGEAVKQTAQPTPSRWTPQGGREQCNAFRCASQL